MEPFEAALIAEAAASSRHPFRTVREEIAAGSEWVVASLVAASLPARPSCKLPRPGPTASALWGSLADASLAAQSGMEVDGDGDGDGADPLLASARAFCDLLAGAKCRDPTSL